MGGLGYWVCRGGGQAGRGLGAKAELSLTSSSEGGGSVSGCGALGLCCYF